MAVHELTVPLTYSDIEHIKLGDTLFLSGPVFTGRSRLQRYVFDEGGQLPFSTADRNAMIHVGPIVKTLQGQHELVSFMPTSSVRFEKWGAQSIERWGLRVIIGKTTMGEDTMAAMRRHGCIHASPQSVSPNLWKDSIKICGVELLDELGSIEASWLLELDKLGPFIVDIDVHGNNYFDKMDQDVAAVKAAVYQKLGIPDGFKPTRLY